MQAAAAAALLRERWCLTQLLTAPLLFQEVKQEGCDTQNSRSHDPGEGPALLAAQTHRVAATVAGFEGVLVRLSQRDLDLRDMEREAGSQSHLYGYKWQKSSEREMTMMQSDR